MDNFALFIYICPQKNPVMCQTLTCFLYKKLITINPVPTGSGQSIFVRLCQHYCAIKKLTKIQNLQHDRLGHEVHFQAEFKLTFVFMF